MLDLRLLQLAAPKPDEAEKGVYILCAVSVSAQKGWADLCENCKQAAQRCYNHLVVDPFRRIPGRVFQLKGRQNQGIWEYEVTGSARLYYRPNPQARVVLVLKAGGHVGPP